MKHKNKVVFSASLRSLASLNNWQMNEVNKVND